MQMVLRMINQSLCKFFVRKNTADATPRHSIFFMLDDCPRVESNCIESRAWLLASHFDATFITLRQMFIPFMSCITFGVATLACQRFSLSIGCQMEKPTT
jgi:hypothetical protein